MPNLAQEFREAIDGATHVDEDFVTAQAIAVEKRGKCTVFDWKNRETRYADHTSRRWRNREVVELPIMIACQLVAEWFDGDEYEHP